MTTTLAVTYYTLREMLRRKLLWAFAIGAVVLAVGIGGVIALAPLQLSQGQARGVFLIQLSDAGGQFFVFLVALGIGATAIYHDIDSGTVVSVFSKPISRLQYTVGKMAASLAALFAVALLLGVAVTAVLEIAGGGHEGVLALDLAKITANQLTILVMVLMLTAAMNNIAAVAIGVVVSFVSTQVNNIYLLLGPSLPDTWRAVFTTLHWLLPRELKYSVIVGIAGARPNLGGLNPALLQSDWTDVLYWAVYVVLMSLVLYLLVRRKQV